MTLFPPRADPGRPLTRLNTTYKGTSGSVKLTYPLTWQGQVETHAQSGTVKTDWPGLRVTRDGLEMSAIVGQGEGRIWVGGVSSNVDLVGKVFGSAARPSAEAAATAANDAGNSPPPTYGEATGASECGGVLASKIMSVRRQVDESIEIVQRVNVQSIEKADHK